MLAVGAKNDVGTKNDITRARWVERQLRRLPAGGRLLDAGAGEQRYRPFCAHLVYVAQDFAQYDPGAVSDGLRRESWDYGRLDIVSDITSIPAPDQSFDAILCTEVFEHIPFPDKALSEFSRLLRSGGTLILTAPFCSLTHFAPFHFATGFSRYFYERHLAAHGFTIEELSANGNFFEYLAQEIRRLPSVSEHYVGRRVGWYPRLLSQLFLRFLHQLSPRDSGSAELLCFGYHVVARRV
jgi:ubiquinone/menaquinone biosynthesis C-methylase UbiE